MAHMEINENEGVNVLYKEHEIHVPQWLLNEAWVDASWRNEACARSTFYQDINVGGKNIELSIWVNYPNPNDREPMCPAPFFVHVYNNLDDVSDFFIDVWTVDQVKQIVNALLASWGREERI